ncbi:class I SAM-dependent methyltransferase [Krasilnikovia sp. MM14-A1259]|uniref:class I SAM-dependent methyltransferase n=1 Tax=Krasilnikovia sp. MM14-A1259 TaxID=3373539 RepID=UPI00382DC4C6
MDTQTIEPAAARADRTLKARHRAMWALGDYHRVAAELVGDLGAVLVDACGVRPGDRVLDVAAGSGSAAIRAALAGGRVIASDLTPELFAPGQAWAAEHGATLAWEQADAEHLPYADAGFDTVLSCLGVMFAPHHRAAAGELARVCRPGGTVGVLSWTPQGFIGEMFAAMKPYAPPPPPGAQPPLWGDEEHVRDLLGEHFTDLTARRRMLRVDRFADPAAFVGYFKAHYGPTIAVYRSIAGEPDSVAALDRALTELAYRYFHDGVMNWEYLLVTGRRH